MRTRHKKLEINHIEKDAVLLYESPCDPGRKVFLYNDLIYKVILLNETLSLNQRMNSLENECEILMRLQGMPGIPQSPLFFHSGDIDYLTYKYIEGKTLEKIITRSGCAFKIKFRLFILLLKLSLRGVAHRDINLHNIIISNSGSLSIIDFDQAIITTVSISLRLNLFGDKESMPTVHGSLSTLNKKWKQMNVIRTKNDMKNLKQYVKNIILKIAPKHIISKYRVHVERKNNSWINEQRNMASMPPNLADTSSRKLLLLRKAWLIARDSNASSPEVPICYYSLNEEGYFFPGERNWLDRWKYFSDVTNYSGKRVLELGCNMGLLSCYLLKEKDVEEVLAVDVDCEILSAAQLVAGAYDVSPCYKLVNFDSEQNWDTELKRFGADIIFALNILNWVNGKDRFLQFLFTFNEVIFEGHESLNEERKMFENEGYTVTEIAISERGRAVIRALKVRQ